ncbi:hypothetical protein TELCIR_17456 [Teladorsagia circumcincta]|uniref:SCP domain-containing protein n=1 Tax=Teladorsagia circumcincta TaxID=45464 RepID=A0A2G9TSS5_TELCI|nr:hypothetical protein TELCIR_17456 [Teladorsagia circumcincta]
MVLMTSRVTMVIKYNRNNEFSDLGGVINKKTSREPLLPEFQKMFEEINERYNEDKMDWDNELAQLALDQSLTPTYNALLRIRRTTMFKHGDQRSFDEQVRRAIEKLFEENGNKVQKLSSGVLFGCNGFYVTIDEDLIVSTTCLYKYDDLA